MTENVYNKPIYTQDGLGIFFGPTFGYFYINDLATNEQFFKNDTIKSLEEAKRKLAEALRNKFKKLRVLVVDDGFNPIKETNAVFYTKDYDNTKVHTLDDEVKGSVFRPRSWSYDIRNTYPATEENKSKVKTIEMYDEQIKNLREQIDKIRKSMKSYTLEQLKKEGYGECDNLTPLKADKIHNP